MSIFRILSSYISSYNRDITATIISAFAVMLPVIVGSVGMSIDVGRAYLVRERLGGALDAAALAAAASETEQSAIEARVQDFFDANYPPEKLGVTYDLSVLLSGDDVIVSASAEYFTAFMQVVGVPTLTVSRRSIVHREVRGLEVALVLDNTGSMSNNDNISALREASANFVNILFSRADNPNAIKIGLVPYSSSVNVGSYGVGETPGGSVYGDGTIFVTDSEGDMLDPDRYTTNYNARNYHSANWSGCVLAAPDGGWNEASSNNDPAPNDATDHVGPWQIYEYQRYGCSDSSCGYSIYRYPNHNCPRTAIVPLTSDQDALLASIGTMQAHGYTLGNYGMAWGHRLLSPEPPFTEGSGWSAGAWDKAIIMMTDGVNTMESNYTAYWRTRNHNIAPGNLNERFEQVCDALKDDGVLIYTVTFASGVDEETKGYYKRCASTGAHYYDAPSQDDLINVFETISRELSNLHVSG